VNSPLSQSRYTAKEYLAVASLADRIFLIGELDTGVTIFNQQVRALNLIWALDTDGQLRQAEEIAVIGGGIAGLTAAMAIRTIFSLSPNSSQKKVTLFEQRSVLCPLQRGCATRWVHPHIYDWPQDGSTNPSAGLPVMNWRAGRASDVATNIVAQWEDDLRRDARSVEQWRNVRYLKVHHKSQEVEWVGENYVDSRQLAEVRGKKRRFDIIIVAIGFGEESRSSKYPADSYWRNETLGQPELTGRQQRYLVSGTGDGGLVDLLRLRIADFREDRIGHQLAPEGSPQYGAIQRLRDSCYRNPSKQGADLFDGARQLGRDLNLIDDIDRRLRADTVTSLQIRKGHRVSDAFRGKSSFVNRFLVSLLFEAGGFSPRFGDLDSIGLPISTK
jgi:FAD dependent oxidoreductase